MRGIKILVNGCFDLFHEGHKYFLSKALEFSCDGKVLILINSDSSIKKLKGDNRPYDKAETRGNNILEFARWWCRERFEYPSVEIKIFRNEEELANLIDNFEPHMIIKGNDRTNLAEIVGYPKWPILTLPRKDDFSTTKVAQQRGLE